MVVEWIDLIIKDLILGVIKSLIRAFDASIKDCKIEKVENKKIKDLKVKGLKVKNIRVEIL